MADADRCVCCGDIIPEGRQVCPQCNAMECAIEALKEHIAAEKIPHCQDCKNFVNCETYSYCEEYGGLVKENDYCSRIEIKAKIGEGIDNAER